MSDLPHVIAGQIGVSEEHQRVLEAWWREHNSEATPLRWDASMWNQAVDWWNALGRDGDAGDLIRKQLKTFIDEGCGYSGHGCMVTGHGEMKAALLAILDLHKSDGGKYPNCVECSCDSALAATECHYSVNWPCPTVRSVAGALGVEVSET